MSMRRKLTLFNGTLVAVSVLGAAWAGSRIGQASSNGEPTDVYAVLLLVVGLFGVAGAYLVALWQTRRLELLAAQAEEVAFAPALQEVEVQGSDELAAIAEALNRLRLDLTRGEEARNQLVADVAHELRTPLTILRGQLESLQEGASELKQENLLPMLDETARMTKLVGDLQQLSLAKSGRLPLQREWVPFGELIDELLSVMEPEAVAQGLWLIPQLAEVGEVYCDRTRIKQVLINLLGNAVRYTPVGGTIQLRTERMDGMVRIQVQDDGPGIPPENLPYLFDRFYRVEGSRNRKSGGMGIGLAIAKEFVEAHGGTVAVESELEEGTTFAIQLPTFPLS